MATFAICLLPVPSVALSALALARRLQKRGHSVWIISTPDLEMTARAEGAGFLPVLSGLFRSGSLVKDLERIATLTWLEKLREVRRATQAYRASMDAMLKAGENDLDRAFDQIRPDLALFYSDIPNLIVGPLVALRRGLRCAYVTPLFSSYESASSPPLMTGVVPRPGFWGRFAVRTAWKRYLWIRNISWRISIWIGFDVDLGRYLKLMMPAPGSPGWPVNWSCFVAPKLTLPEFFLAPRALDFPDEQRADRHWLGWTLNDAPADLAFPWERLDRTKTIVYCSLGTMSLTTVSRPNRIAFFQAVLDAISARPHLQLVLATSGGVGPGDLRIRDENAIVVNRLPQLEILKRTQLMITHCGLNSLMECASLGVPMIAVPLAFDQFGNAARVLYHGLGLRGDFGRTTADSIGRLVDAVLADVNIKERSAAMAALARDSVSSETAIAALEVLAEAQ